MTVPRRVLSAIALTAAVLWLLDPTTSLMQRPALIAPFGASTFLIFAVPNSPMAQPWAVVVGNTAAALIGLATIHVYPQPLPAAAIAVLLALLATAALRASEIGADVIFKATKVDGVYDKDPNKFDDAVRYNTVTYNEALSQNLKVMDGTAFTLCQDNSIPIVVFDMTVDGNIRRALTGDDIGTVVCA